MYGLLRRLLFQLDAERAYTLAMAALRIWQHSQLHRLASSVDDRHVPLLGLKFPNPIGLAAGFDKSGRYIDALAQLGFGFIEVGTVTPRSQPGNPAPNLFRLVEDRGLINRMGFNNDGVEAVARRLEKRRYRGVCGVNIGKNFDTPLEQAARDYLICLRAVYACADYVTMNISSPNTPGLRTLQQPGSLEKLLDELVNERQLLSGIHRKHVPLLIKIAPDLHEPELQSICEILLKSGVDGIVATNTTTTRPPSLRSHHSDEAGGLSGAPLHSLSVNVVKALRAQLGPAFPIIGVGGISSAETAHATFAAGANLIQLYSGLVYEGPCLVSRLVRSSRLGTVLRDRSDFDSLVSRFYGDANCQRAIYPAMVAAALSCRPHPRRR